MNGRGEGPGRHYAIDYVTAQHNYTVDRYRMASSNSVGLP